QSLPDAEEAHQECEKLAFFGYDLHFGQRHRRRLLAQPAQTIRLLHGDVENVLPQAVVDVQSVQHQESPRNRPSGRIPRSRSHPTASGNRPSLLRLNRSSASTAAVSAVNTVSKLGFSRPVKRSQTNKCAS